MVLFFLKRAKGVELDCSLVSFVDESGAGVVLCVDSFLDRLVLTFLVSDVSGR